MLLRNLNKKPRSNSRTNKSLTWLSTRWQLIRVWSMQRKRRCVRTSFWTTMLSISESPGNLFFSVWKKTWRTPSMRTCSSKASFKTSITSKYSHFPGSSWSDHWFVISTCRVYGTWDFKSLHLWSMDTGAHLKTIKMMEETRTHCTISAVAFSHKYRLYLVITSKF